MRDVCLSDIVLLHHYGRLNLLGQFTEALQYLNYGRGYFPELINGSYPCVAAYAGIIHKVQRRFARKLQLIHKLLCVCN